MLLAGVRGPVGALRTRAAQGVLREEGDARGAAGRDGPRGLAGALVEDQLVAPERLVSRTMPETVKCKASITCNKVLGAEASLNSESVTLIIKSKNRRPPKKHPKCTDVHKKSSISVCCFIHLPSACRLFVYEYRLEF